MLSVTVPVFGGHIVLFRLPMSVALNFEHFLWACCGRKPVASTWVQSWGSKRRRGGVWGGVFLYPPGTPPPHRGGVWEGQIFGFVISGEFWGAKFKVFLSWAPSVRLGSILWQILDFRAKQWIKDCDIIKCSHWATTTNIGLLYPKVRNNISGDIPIDVPPTKILEGMSPRLTSPAGLTPVNTATLTLKL